MSIDNCKFQFVGLFKLMRRWFCYFFVTFENDVLKSPFLSCFLRYKFIQVPSSAQLKMKMTQISSGSFFILEPADEFLETQWFQGLACRLGRLAACRPLDDARPIFRKSFRGLREIQEKSSDECLHSRRTLFCIYKQDEVLR